MNDPARFTGNYLRIVGYASLACMLVAMFYNNFININLSFILFIWAGSEIRQRNERARSWVMRFSIICALAIVATCVYVESMAIEKISIDLFGFLLTDMPGWLFYTTMVLFLIASLVPFFTLFGSKAKLQFEGENNGPKIDAKEMDKLDDE